MMPEEDSNILKYNHGKKSLKTPFAIYVGTESLLENISTHNSNPEESSTTKMSKLMGCGYLSFTHCSFDSSGSKHGVYRGADGMKTFFTDPKKQK